MGELYSRHEKQTKNPAEMTGNRYEIEFLMSGTQKLKGLTAALLRLKILNDNPKIILMKSSYKKRLKELSRKNWLFYGLFNVAKSLYGCAGGRKWMFMGV